MALAFNPNRTFFRGLNKYKQIHPFIEKKRGRGCREGSRKKTVNSFTSESEYEFFRKLILPSESSHKFFTDFLRP